MTIILDKFALKMGHAKINVRTRACSKNFNVRSKLAALAPNVSGKELKGTVLETMFYCNINSTALN